MGGAIQKYLKSVCPGGFSTDCISKIFTKAWNGLKKQLTVGAMLENGKKLFAGLKNLAGLDGRNKFTMAASGNGEHLWAFDGIGDMYYRNFRDTDSRHLTQRHCTASTSPWDKSVPPSPKL